MAITFECDRCGKSYTLRDEFAGKSGKCKQCGEKMTIPMATDSDGYMFEHPAPEPVEAAPLLPRATAYQPTPTSERPKPRKKKKAKSKTKSRAYDGDGLRYAVWVGIVIAFVIFRVIVRRL